jgi:ATP:ADP antiporter, AAA family
VNSPGAAPPKSKSLVDRALSVFTEVRAGESGTALLLTLNVFLIFTSYYIIKPVREALILATENGAEYKSYAAAGQAILLLLVAVPAFSWLAGRVARRRLMQTVFLFFATNLVIFYFVIKFIGGASTTLGLSFYVWVGIFNLMVPALFWSFANDLYSPEQGKRLFALVAFGASSGAVLGSAITSRLIGPLGLDQLLLASAALLTVALAITLAVDRRPSPREEASGNSSLEPEGEEESLGQGGAFRAFSSVLQDRYLLGIALLLLLLNWVNTTGEFVLGDTVKTAIEGRGIDLGLMGVALDDYVGENIGRFYANFFSVVNVVGVVVQLLLVSRILKYLGVRGALMILPTIALVGYSILAFFPILAAVRWAKTAENATDYSLQNTVRQALFLPTTREQKYNAKQAIDTFFVRSGDVLSAGLVYVGLHQFGWGAKGFALFNLGLVVAWLLLASNIGRRYRRLTAKRN